MSQVLYEWGFANYICRVAESEPGIVHFEQARKESGGDPRIMEFQRTATPMGAANEIIQLHRALAEAMEERDRLRAASSPATIKDDALRYVLCLLVSEEISIAKAQEVIVENVFRGQPLPETLP